MFSFILDDLHALQGRLESGEDVAHQVVGQRAGRLDALLFVGDRGGLHGADPDRQVTVSVDLLEQHDRLVAGQLDRTPTTLSSRTAASVFVLSSRTVPSCHVTRAILGAPGPDPGVMAGGHYRPRVSRRADAHQRRVQLAGTAR